MAESHSCGSAGVYVVDFQTFVRVMLLKVPWFTPGFSYCRWWGVECCMTASELSIPGCSQGLQSISVLELAGQRFCFCTCCCGAHVEFAQCLAVLCTLLLQGELHLCMRKLGENLQWSAEWRKMMYRVTWLLLQATETATFCMRTAVMFRP